MRTISLRPSVCVAASLLAIFCGAIAQAQQTDAFSKANAEYAAGRYREAIDLYSDVVQAGEASAALFYNLGNAWFRSGDPGKAILNYQRALALDPEHPEAQANLRLVRDKARALELRRQWWERFAAPATASHFAVVAAAAFWCAAFAIAVVFLRRRRSVALKGLAAVSVVLCATAIAALYARETGPHGQSFAIITGKDIQARLATADNAGTVLALPPGSEITILSNRGDWMYAALPNDLRGWIPADSAERVRL